jgi:hypothetical protein
VLPDDGGRALPRRWPAAAGPAIYKVSRSATPTLNARGLGFMPLVGATTLPAISEENCQKFTQASHYPLFHVIG